MMRYNKIIENKIFKESLKKTGEFEKSRKFCRHDFQHFLDVARISYILCLEKKSLIDKDLIYAAAFLHDIGRYKEYESGISHECAGARIAEEILKECGYDTAEIKMITEAILSHRENSTESPLGEILYSADKLSRCCTKCAARSECCWSEEKKNKSILY